MPKFIVEAIKTEWFEVEIEAEDEVSAYAELDEWISDDFEDYSVNAQWEFGIIESPEVEN
jgi:hypothetical protein